jgi:outer membrane protein assembly factor BamB
MRASQNHHLDEVKKMRTERKTMGRITLTVLLTVMMALAFNAQPVAAVDWWPMFHHDLQLTGYTTSSAPDIADLQWTYQTGTPISSSPAVVDGIAYIGSGDWEGGGPGGLYALNTETGALVWSYPTSQAVVSSPAVDGGKVFFGCYDGNVYALDALTGAFVWSFSTGSQVWSCPAVHNGKVFISSTDGNTYCIDIATGTQTWSAPFGFNSAMTVANGKVFVGTHSGIPTLAALDESNGSLIWRYDRADDGFINDNGVCVQNGKVYFGIVIFNDVGRVLCLPENDPNGNGVINETEVIWTYLCRNYTAPEGFGPGWVTSTPAIHNGNIFVGSDDGYLYCLNAATGAMVWEYNIGSATWSAPAVADGKVFFGAKDHTLYALDEATGGMVWSYFTGTSRIDVSPAVANGQVFIGSENGKVYAFGQTILVIPTLTEWGMIIFCLLLFGWMALVIVRRRKAVNV